ncbi:MAG: hypothetical protein V4581_17950 [Bacteroidota bacterium]
MNSELENLVNLALADGYITDKEKNVLKRKAEGLGFDVDELEMILDGKLYELNTQNRAKVEKCPNCGEVISGLSKVCPSCDYILTTEKIQDSDTLQESFNSLEQSVATLKSFNKAPAVPVINSCFKILVTGGLYIIYKKLIKKEPLFDRYAAVHKSIIFSTNAQAESLLRKYGANNEIKTNVQRLIDERDTIIKKRQSGDYIAAGATFMIIGILIYLFTLIPKPDPKTAVEDPEDKTERLIVENKISLAKQAALQVESKYEREKYLEKILIIEIDSLTDARDFNRAIRLANQIKIDIYQDNTQEKKIDEIVETEVDLLIKEKNFTRAGQRAELASITNKYTLKSRIELAEAIVKDSIAQITKTTKAKTKKRKR